jgi:hypothetical protein
LPVLPAANHAEFDLVPVTLHNSAIQMPIAVAHHHTVRLDHQLPRRRIMLWHGWFVDLLDVSHRLPLLAF